MSRSKSSGRWLSEHHNDPYVKKALAAGYRSRAAFKLLEIQRKDKLLRQGQTVVDLGAAPGGWSQIAQALVGQSGQVLALDILPMDPIDGVKAIEGDFLAAEVLAQLTAALDGRPVDLVLSDMAPNMSGTPSVDQARSFALAEAALLFASQVLKHQGDFLIKVFQGEGFEAYLRELRGAFAKVVTRKPDASRARSREVYLLARGFKGARSDALPDVRA